MARKPNRFTVFDMMEQRGVFEANPANQDSRDPETGESLYKGPVEYPKMMYHPTGETRVSVPAEAMVTPFGPKLVGEQRELVHQVVQNAEEEAALREAGWHSSPSRASAIAKGEPVPESKDEKIARLEAELAQAQQHPAAALEPVRPRTGLIKPLAE
jgi:hypothetical protein